MNSFLGISFWAIAKWLSLFGLLIYIVFSFVVVRQVKLMGKTVDVGYNGPLVLATLVHFAFSILVFLLALIIL